MKDTAYQTWTSSSVLEFELKLFAPITLLLLCRFEGNPDTIEFVLLASSWAFWPWRGHVGEIPVRMSAGVEIFEVAANNGS
jgi:hypothetical protein